MERHLEQSKLAIVIKIQLYLAKKPLIYKSILKPVWAYGKEQ